MMVHWDSLELVSCVSKSDELSCSLLIRELTGFLEIDDPIDLTS